METIQFKAKIKNGMIEIPSQYQGKFKDGVRVTLISEDNEEKAKDYLDELMAHPLKVPGFRPLSRDEAHARD